MKRVKSKYSLILACVMAACTVLFWVVYCFRGQELRFLLSGFVTFAWGVVSVYDAFHKKPIEERVAEHADERDVYLAMKASRTAMGVFNKCLFIASALCFWMYSVYRLEFLLPVRVTLSGAVLFLFLLLLCVNLYYEKRG